MRFSRLFLFWFLTFISIYITSFLSVFVWTILNYNNIFLVIGMICPPLFVLLFGWLCFRRVGVLLFSQKIKNAIIWIALDFIGGAIMLWILKGGEPVDIFSSISLLTEAVNFFALLVVFYISAKQPERFVKASPPSSDLLPPAQG